MTACNDAEVRGGIEHGDPTEVALVVFARDSDIGSVGGLPATPQRVAEIPFDAKRRRMLTVHDPEDADFVAYAKGAPEALLPYCVLDDAQRTAAQEQAQQMAGAGLRVLAAASRDLVEVPPDLADAESDLTLLGLIGLLDPPREEAAAAVAECRTAGIVPVMITGDHPDTAHAIAERVGVAEAHHDSSDVITGRDLTDLDDAALAARVLDARVYARVDPAQKIRIVRALQGMRPGRGDDR